MIAMVLGFVTNIALDYVLVWVANWGMEGAALATIIGQAVTMIASILLFIHKKCRLGLPPFLELLKLWGQVLKTSLSPFGPTFSPIITMLLMNRFLLLYGNEQSVAVYGCIGYITTIIYLHLQGVGDGCQPLISQYYGEKDQPSVASTRKLAYITSAVVTIVSMAGIFFARTKIGILFGASADANQGVAQYLPYFLASLLFVAFVRIATSYF